MNTTKSVAINIIKENLALFDNKLNENEINHETILFGAGGMLDSMDLVNLIVAIEQSVTDEFSTDITIADARAMSQKSSPFRTIESLATYIEMLVKEQQANEQ